MNNNTHALRIHTHQRYSFRWVCAFARKLSGYMCCKWEHFFFRLIFHEQVCALFSRKRDYCSAIWISLAITPKFPFVFHLLTVIFIERRAWEPNARSQHSETKHQYIEFINGCMACTYAIVLVAMCTLNKKWLILRLFLSVLFVCQVHGLWLDEKRNGITLRFLHVVSLDHSSLSLCVCLFRTFSRFLLFFSLERDGFLYS